MKKIALLLICSSLGISAQDYSFISENQPEEAQLFIDKYHSHVTEEYQLNSQEYLSESSLSEYEMHMSDQVKPQPVSPFVAFLTRVGCSALINYIALQEKTKICCAKIKSMMTHWYALLLYAINQDR